MIQFTNKVLLFSSLRTIAVLTLLSGCSPTISENESPIQSQQPSQVKPQNFEPDTASDNAGYSGSDNRESSLSRDWDDLPEISTPKPTLANLEELTPIDTLEETASEFPVPTFPSLPKLTALWSAGILNGSPKDIYDESISQGEYKNTKNTDSVLHILNPTDIPPFIYPNQRLVFHLPGFPTDSYQINIVTAGGVKESIREEYLDRELLQQRNLTVRWNDHLLWRRWLPPVFFLTKVALPPVSISPESNLLVLENTGTQTLPLDALWMEAIPSEGNPYYVSLEDAHWLNQSDSKWVKNTTLTLLLPVVSSAWKPPPNTSEFSPLLSPADLPNDWKLTLDSYSRLQSKNPDLAQAFNPWMKKMGQAVVRGMIPVIEIKLNEQNEKTNDVFKTAVFLFGNLTHTWILPGDLATPENIEFLRSQSPHATIYTIYSSKLDVDGNTITRYPMLFNGLLSEYSSKYRKYFDGEMDEMGLKKSLAETLILRALFRGYDWKKQSFHSNEFFAAAGDYLMVNDQPLTVHGGFPGSPFFPAGDDTPGLMWHYLKPLFRFGGPDHFKSVANLTPDSQGSEIGRSAWAAASNGKDSVQVMVSNHSGLNGHKVNLELPLPWTGPTQILHHSVRSTWGSTKTPKANSVRRTIETKGENSHGWVTIPFELEGVHVFELSPATTQPVRNIQAPNKVAFAELIETDTLFGVSQYAPPPWWSRMPMGTDYFSHWRFSGNVTVNADVDATRDGAPDWVPFKDIHGAIPEEVDAVSPLRDTSITFQFGEPIENVAQVLRAQYNRYNTTKGKVMGIWLRANKPPGFKAKFDAFNAVPRTRFYMGKLPYRQLIEIEYGRWYFITSDSEIWQHSISKYNPYLIFWPADPEEPNPIIEVNSFEMYQVKISDMDITPEKCLGFLQEDANGKLQILVLGVPGRPAFWRQRLPNLIDVTLLTHTVDKELLTTAETPEEDPPERVRHKVALLEDSKILEIEIEKMPAPPSPSHLKKIEKAYPLLRNAVSQRGLSVFLMEEKEPENEK